LSRDDLNVETNWRFYEPSLTPGALVIVKDVGNDSTDTSRIGIVLSRWVEEGMYSVFVGGVYEPIHWTRLMVRNAPTV
jgi:hypothetical protein